MLLSERRLFCRISNPPFLKMDLIKHFSFIDRKIDEEDANTIMVRSESEPVHKANLPTSQFQQHSTENKETLPEANNGLSANRPTRCMMEIDDCLPEYCMECPLWKPFSSRHFCWLKFRCRVRVLVEKKYFEWFILVTVFLSSFALVWQTLRFICRHIFKLKSYEVDV